MTARFQLPAEPAAPHEFDVDIEFEELELFPGKGTTPIEGSANVSYDPWGSGIWTCNMVVIHSHVPAGLPEGSRSVPFCRHLIIYNEIDKDSPEWLFFKEAVERYAERHIDPWEHQE